MARVESLIRAEVDVPLPETKEDRKNNYIFISKNGIGMKLDLVYSTVIVALVVKIIYDWLSSGRTEKGVFVTKVLCNDHRDSCCISQIKKEAPVMHERMKNVEHDQIVCELPKVQKDLINIETRVDSIEKRHDKVDIAIISIQKKLSNIEKTVAETNGYIKAIAENSKRTQ